MIIRCIGSGCIFAVAIVAASTAIAECVRAIGAIPSLQGEAQVQAETAGSWRPAVLDEQLCPGDLIHVGHRSRAEVTIVNQPNIRLDQNTALHLPADDDPLVVKLLYGAAYFFSRHPRVLTINTPFVDAAVEGTEFLVRVEAERTLIIVFAGRVRASNPHGELAIANGQSAVAEAGRAPTPYLIVRPRDAVQWTLYYPAILPALADPSGASAQELPEPLRGAVELAAAGELPAAFARFEAIPDADRGSDYYLYRAAALLSVGRVDEARADIDQALALDPASGPAYALRAVVAVARNEDAPALEDARRAVELSPRSATAKIALSYAEQAQFRIEAARDALQQAVKDEPENALAWARLSELWLMGGYLERSKKAAKKARKLAPELARVQTVLGFAELAEINTGKAKKDFRRAIDIDSANPLPRFGLGLATIRAGDLEQGRKEIEIAVALDPVNSLLRSYLGKAYFEERTTDPATYFEQLLENFPNQENKLAAEQYGIAKELDPNDPTPWLYDAIRLQSENRPVEALHDIEKSTELNDNRAVYRSRELLDQDQAARGTSLARIYNDLGFEQLGINEATQALALDPSNSAAHRFLSDVYTTQPRRETARVSELLQAQLLQEVNINPVQPSLSETNLDISARGGPSRVGFNEYTPLFDRNRAQLNLSGEVGNHYTRAEETVVSGVYDNVSVSAGRFYYSTDGFRQNYDLRNDVGDFFIQSAVTPELNLQAEVIARRSEYGDRFLNFDSSQFLPNLRNDLDQDIGRIGFRYAPDPESTVLGSVIYSHRHLKSTAGFSADGLTLDIDRRIKSQGLEGEGEYIYQNGIIEAIAGFGAYDLDARLQDSLEGTFTVVGLPEISVSSAERANFNVRHYTPYAYLNMHWPDSLIWTVGASYDFYNGPDRRFSKFNPKFGVQWFPLPDLRLRAAVFRTVKPPFVADRTIQPTEVAGFTQFFDDSNETEAWVYGVGLDYRVAKNVNIGIDASKRSYDEPLQFADVQAQETLGTKTLRDPRTEYLASPYIYWCLSSELVLRAGFNYDLFESNPKTDTTIPETVRTLSAPLSLRYFSPTGFLASLTGTFVHQDVRDRFDGVNLDSRDDSAFVFDAAIGYRFPERRGVVGLEVLNLFDEHLNYQDDSFRIFRDAFGGTQSPTPARFLPNRTILGRMTLNF